MNLKMAGCSEIGRGRVRIGEAFLASPERGSARWRSRAQSAYLLSTRGIHGTLTNAEILAIVAEGGALPDIVERLIERAFTADPRGETMDASCVLVRIS